MATSGDREVARKSTVQATGTAFAKCLARLLVLCLAPAAYGQTLSDPTRPPPAWVAPQPGASPATPAGEPDDKGSSGLRVLVVGKTRKYAIVDGQVVKPGDTLNGMKVLAITSNAVVTRGEGATESVKLAPDVEKKQVKKAKASRRDR